MVFGGYSMYYGVAYFHCSSVLSCLCWCLHFPLFFVMVCYLVADCFKFFFFFFTQKPAYEMRISDWSSDVCSSDLADTGNHSVRRIQLRSGDIDTICGAGRPGVPVEGVITDPRAVALDQPRAIALSAEAMHIATAGDNRIWTYNLGKRELPLLAGSGALGLSDGSGNRASVAQPVGLATVQQVLYACDAAGSAIRSVNARSGQVTTLLGQDTWNFGKADGARVEARLQQPQAIALDPDAPVLWIADSGNDALRTLRLGGGELATFELPQPLHAPSGMAIADRVVWIADTDAHAVLRLDTRNGALRHVPIGE